MDRRFRLSGEADDREANAVARGARPDLDRHPGDDRRQFRPCRGRQFEALRGDRDRCRFARSRGGPLRPRPRRQDAPRADGRDGPQCRPEPASAVHRKARRRRDHRRREALGELRPDDGDGGGARPGERRHRHRSPGNRREHAPHRSLHRREGFDCRRRPGSGLPGGRSGHGRGRHGRRGDAAPRGPARSRPALRQSGAPRRGEVLARR